MNTRWHMQRVLLAWLRGDERDEEVYALRPTPTGETRVTELPIGAVARALAGDPTLLPEDVAASLGFADDATFGGVAARIVTSLDAGRNVDEVFPLAAPGPRNGFLRPGGTAQLAEARAEGAAVSTFGETAPGQAPA